MMHCFGVFLCLHRHLLADGGVRTDFVEGKTMNMTKKIQPLVILYSKQTEMDLKRNPGGVSQAASAVFRVTDLNWRGTPNPIPRVTDDGELLVDEYLSPRKLVSRHSSSQ